MLFFVAALLALAFETGAQANAEIANWAKACAEAINSKSKVAVVVSRNPFPKEPLPENVYIPQPRDRGLRPVSGEIDTRNSKKGKWQLTPETRLAKGSGAVPIVSIEDIERYHQTSLLDPETAPISKTSLELLDDLKKRVSESNTHQKDIREMTEVYFDSNASTDTKMRALRLALEVSPTSADYLLVVEKALASSDADFKIQALFLVDSIFERNAKETVREKTLGDALTIAEAIMKSSLSIDTRLHAFEIISRYLPEKAADVAQLLLIDRDESFRTRALTTAERVLGDKIVPIALDALRTDPSPEVATAAIKVLSSHADNPSALQAVRKAWNPTTIKELEKNVETLRPEDNDNSASLQKIHAIRSMGPALRKLERQTEERDSPYYLSHRTNVLVLLSSAAKDLDPRVRIAAMQAYAEAYPNETDRYVEPFLEDESVNVRGFALHELLVRQKEDGARFVPRFIEESYDYIDLVIRHVARASEDLSGRGVNVGKFFEPLIQKTLSMRDFDRLHSVVKAYARNTGASSHQYLKGILKTPIEAEHKLQLIETVLSATALGLGPNASSLFISALDIFNGMQEIRAILEPGKLNYLGFGAVAVVEHYSKRLPTSAKANAASMQQNLALKAFIKGVMSRSERLKPETEKMLQLVGQGKNLVDAFVTLTDAMILDGWNGAPYLQSVYGAMNSSQKLEAIKLVSATKRHDVIFNALEPLIHDASLPVMKSAIDEIVSISKKSKEKPYQLVIQLLGDKSLATPVRDRLAGHAFYALETLKDATRTLISFELGKLNQRFSASTLLDKIAKLEKEASNIEELLQSLEPRDAKELAKTLAVYQNVLERSRVLVLTEAYASLVERKFKAASDDGKASSGSEQTMLLNSAITEAGKVPGGKFEVYKPFLLQLRRLAERGLRSDIEVVRKRASDLNHVLDLADPASNPPLSKVAAPKSVMETLAEKATARVRKATSKFRAIFGF